MTIKPYKFNNYENSLPKKERGYYDSHQVKPEINKLEGIEKRDGIQLSVDLTNVQSKEEVFDRIYPKLGFFYEPNMYSWDALGDYLWFFPESSELFNQISPGVINIRVVNINHMWKFSEKDYAIFCEILMTSTDNSRFDDGLRLIIEVVNN